MIWTIQKLISWSTNYLSEKGVETPRLDTEILLAFVLQWPRIQLYTRFDQPLSESELQNFKTLLKRRATREPLAYILGEKEFYSLVFKVNSQTLIPRPESEHLVELGLEALMQFRQASQNQNEPIPILDLATGSACILIALLKEASKKNLQLSAWGVDFSPGALEVAEENAKHHELNTQITWVEHDLSKAWPETLSGPFALITANLPYVSAAEHKTLSLEVRDFEPRSALVPGSKNEMPAQDSTGLEGFAWVLPQLSSRLLSGGSALLEIGSDQGQALQEMSRKLCAELNFEILKDLSGKDRVVRLQKPKKATKS